MDGSWGAILQPVRISKKPPVGGFFGMYIRCIHINGKLGGKSSATLMGQLFMDSFAPKSKSSNEKPRVRIWKSRQPIALKNAAPDRNSRPGENHGVFPFIYVNAKKGLI